jgi:hypothetical protein
MREPKVPAVSCAVPPSSAHVPYYGSDIRHEPDIGGLKDIISLLVTCYTLQERYSRHASN